MGKTKKLNYADMFTLRKDGRYMGFFREPSGKRKAVYDRDPERLYNRLLALEAGPGPLTFEAAADAWERKHRERVGANTAETYKAPLRRICAQFDGMDAEEVSAMSVQAFLNDLGKQGFSRRSVQLHRDIINMIFNDAIVDGRLRFNPCSAVQMPRNLPTKKRELPSDAAIVAVKNGAGAPFGLFAIVCLYAGLRRGEALALQFEDIDRDARLIHVNKAVEYIGNNPHIKPPKTAAGVRDVPLLAPLASALPERKHGLVFPREDGGLLTKTQFRKRWLKYCDSIGYEITAHQLRHGYATILYEAGIADKDAQELLGHSSIAVTRDVYTHIRQRRKEDTARRLNEYLQGDF